LQFRAGAAAAILRFVNYTFHDMASEMGIPFEELLARARTDTSYDISLDEKQKAIALEGKCVLGSRLAIWLLQEHAVTVYLDGTPQVRGKRIAIREKKDPAQAIAETIERDRADHDRFLSLYRIDNDDFSFADLIIDTEEGDQHHVAARILAYLETHQ
jgi:cytidylate kinase